MALRPCLFWKIIPSPGAFSFYLVFGIKLDVIIIQINTGRFKVPVLALRPMNALERNFMNSTPKALKSYR